MVGKPSSPTPSWLRLPWAMAPRGSLLAVPNILCFTAITGRVLRKLEVEWSYGTFLLTVLMTVMGVLRSHAATRETEESFSVRPQPLPYIPVQMNSLCFGSGVQAGNKPYYWSFIFFRWIYFMNAFSPSSGCSIPASRTSVRWAMLNHWTSHSNWRKFASIAKAKKDCTIRFVLQICLKN
jgi:hypothetical protein